MFTQLEEAIEQNDIETAKNISAMTGVFFNAMELVAERMHGIIEERITADRLGEVLNDKVKADTIAAFMFDFQGILDKLEKVADDADKQLQYLEDKQWEQAVSDFEPSMTGKPFYEVL